MAERIASRAEFKAWLDRKKPPREICVALAVRAALRALPVVGDEAEPQRFAQLIATVFRATALAWVGAKYPTRANELRAATAYAYEACDAVAAYAAAYAAAAAATDDVAYSAIAATAAITYAAAARGADATSFWDALSRDLALCEVGARSFVLASHKLWPVGEPEWVHAYSYHLRETLPAQDHWHVWTDWYDRRLEGISDSERSELIFARVPHEYWDKGPATVNIWIAERLEGLGPNEEHKLDPQEFNSSLEQLLAQDPHGASIEVVEGKARIASSGNADDAGVAQEPQTIQLHERVRTRANAARDRVQRLANQPGFGNIAATVDEFARLVAADTQEVAGNISTVWELSTAIGTFIERDNEVRAGRGGMTPQMDADARETLDQLLVAAAPFVRRFPTARQNDEEVRLFKQTRESVETTKRILEQAASENLIETQSNTIIVIATAAAERSEGVQSEKSRSWLGKTARNLIVAFVAVSGAVIVSPVGKFAEKAIEDFYEHSRSRAVIQKFLLDKESDVIELFKDLPSDVRAALQEIYRRLREGKTTSPPFDPTQHV